MVNLVVSEYNISEALNEYSNYKPNWGDGSLVPDELAIKNSRQFLVVMTTLDIPLPSVNLSSDGEINFIWGKPESPGYIHIGFMNAGYSYYAINAERKEVLRDSDVYNEEDLKCLLKSILLYKQKYQTL
jgi:hypothetical protein